MPVRLSRSPDRHDEWRVTLNSTTIVCFSGPFAREQALRRSVELAELLHDIAEIEVPAERPGPPRKPTPA